MSQSIGKPSMRDIQEQYYFDSAALAESAGVQVLTVRAMLTDQPVRRLQAELVLAALSEHLGKAYNLESVSVVVLAEEGVEQ